MFFPFIKSEVKIISVDMKSGTMNVVFVAISLNKNLHCYFYGNIKCIFEKNTKVYIINEINKMKLYIFFFYCYPRFQTILVYNNIHVSKKNSNVLQL